MSATTYACSNQRQKYSMVGRQTITINKSTCRKVAEDQATERSASATTASDARFVVNNTVDALAIVSIAPTIQ